jgi:hypothetical protein
MEERPMSVLVRYTPASLTADQYEEASRRIEKSLGWPPPGLDTHVCFGSEGSLRVSEVWDSRDQCEAFRDRIMPLLAEVGIEFSGEPEIFEVHAIEKRS